MKKKRFGNISKKGKVGIISALFMMVLTAIMAFDFAGVRSLVADKLGLMAAGQVPAHVKDIQDNGNGTYKLSLDVTGDTDVNKKASNVNVLLILDTSNSMVLNNVTGTNVRRADAAEKAVYDFTHDLFEYQDTDNNPTNIQVALVTFNSESNTKTLVEWTSTETDITNNLSSTGNRNSAKLTYNQGTNWEAALREGKSALGTADSDPTYVIFITDGAPTRSVTNAGNQQAGEDGFIRYYRQARDEARDIATYKTGTSEEVNTFLYGIYAYGETSGAGNADYLDDLIYYSQHNADRAGGANGNTNTVDTDDKYFTAANTDDLVDAVSTIFEDIVTAMGVSSVEISDGTTQNVKTSTGDIAHLLSVDSTSFEYWLDIPLTRDGNNYYFTDNNANKINVNISGTTANFSWTDSKGNAHTATYQDASLTNLKLKVKWKEKTDFYPAAPTAEVKATGETSSVDWDLSSLKTLLNGVKYTVTFDVYPSQETYDLIADLKNGTKTYDSLDSEIQKYIVDHENGSYSLRTNTEATLSYDDTRDDAGVQTKPYENPGPVGTSVDTIAVQKIWNNDIDGRKDRKIELELKRDGSKAFDVKLDGEVDVEEGEEPKPGDEVEPWKAEGIFISTGLAKTDSNGNLVVLDAGHDYTFGELGSELYNWELEAITVHPMVIDGVLTELTLVEGSTSCPSGSTCYTIGNKLYKVSGTNPIITATNHRRSNLNIKKTVDGANANPDSEFEFTIKVTQKDGNNKVIADDPDTNDDDLWFSVQDKDGNWVDYGTTISEWSRYQGTDSQTGKTTYYYYAPNDTELVIKLKAGYNIRFTNLVSNTDVSVVEGNTANYSLGDITTPEGFDSKNDSKEIEINSKKFTGHIGENNTSYKVEYKNNNDVPETIDIPVEKVWENDEDGAEGLRTSVEVELLIKNADGSTTTTGNKLTLTEAKDWVDTFTNLVKYADGKEIIYSVKENTTNDHYTTEVSGSNTKLFVTNTRKDDKLIDIPVEKVWENDEDGAEGLRTSVEVELLIKNADGSTTTTDKKLTLTKEKGWIDSFTDLAKYADGELVHYTVKENTTNAHYTTEVSGNNTKLFVTNTRKDDKLINIPVEKVWENDEDGSEGLRTSVEVELLVKNADGSTTTTNKKLTLTEAKEWKDEFKDLAKYADGKEIQYSIRENTTNAHYTTEVSGNNTKLFVTNTRKDDKLIDIPVEKVWENDEDGAEGLRTSVEVELLVKNADGSTTTTNKKLTLTEAKEWKDTFVGVAKYADGKEIQYSVKENTTNDHYITEVSGNNTKLFVTNTRKDDKTIDIPVEKVWDNDDDGAEGLRTSVEVELLINNADGSTTTTDKKLTLTKEKGWIDSFTGVAKYANGELIHYSVKENTTNAHYTTEVSGNNTKLFVTNTRKDDKLINIPVEKQWLGDNNGSEGLRTSVEVELLIGKESTGKKLTLTSEKSWKDEFKDLAKYANGQEIDYQIKEVKVDHYSTSITGDKTNGFIVKNTREDDKSIDIPVEKVWENDEDGAEGLRTSVEVELLVKNADGSTTTTNKKLTLTEAKEWKDTFVGVAKYADGKEIQYSVRENTTNDHYTTEVSGDNAKLIITNTRKDDKYVSISVVKDWQDKGDQDGIRPDTLNVVLSNGKTETVYQLKEADGWSLTLNNLPKYIDGKEATYTWSEPEANVPEGYTYVGKNTEGTTTTITNKHETEVTAVNVQKVWNDNDNQDGLRSAIEVELFKTIKDAMSGEDITSTTGQTATLSESNNWFASFTGLDKKANGELILYSVVENTQLDGYNAPVVSDPINEGTITVTNKRDNFLTTSRTVKKVWHDDDNQDGKRPTELVVKLMDGTTEVGSVTLKESNNWTATIDGLPLNRGGSAINYTWAEFDMPEGYTLEDKTTEGLVTTITNKHESEIIPINVEKIWDNSKNTYGFTNPTEIKATLKDGETVLKEVPLNVDNNWKATFGNYPRYRDGSEILYTVEEEAIGDYETVIEGSGTEGFTIKNTYIVQPINVIVEKSWKDNSDSDGQRPTSINVTLTGKVGEDPVYTDNATIEGTEKDTWSYTFENLPKTYFGKEITYSVTEEAVEGYEDPEYTGEITTKLVITNPYKTATVSYHVKKVWQEDDGYTGGRPESITVKLTANDGSEPRTAELSESNNWYCEFNDLPKFMNHGEAITYTIEEVEVPETYESEPSIETEGDVSTVTITNIRATEIFWERIQKIWDDDNNKLGYRPNSIDVEIYANGELFDTVTLTAEEDWKLVITLPRYIDGVEAKYSIKELNVPEYLTTIDGFTITNKLNHTEIVPPNTMVESRTDGLMSVMVILGTFGILGYSVRKRYE